MLNSDGNVAEIRCEGPGAWHPLTPSWVPPSTSLELWTVYEMAIVVCQYSQIMEKVEMISLCEPFIDRGVPVPQIMEKSGSDQLVRVTVE